ncbi:MAG: hypothetical protein HC842_00485 [Cytophagales bacterium]|nr:hypothetical protein [Cytophagales bacterium]
MLLVAVSLGAQSYPTNSLVAYYPFDNDAKDALGNYDGTAYGSTSFLERLH